MALKKIEKNESKKINNASKFKINALIDNIIDESNNSSQLDSFYKEKILEMCSIHEQYFSFISKRFLKANLHEKEILLKLFSHFQGFDHIKFLQQFIRKEPFLPRTGILILELFNKSDAILEEGLASNLLELDNLTQRVIQEIVTQEKDDGYFSDDTLIDLFLARNDNEKEGIIHQLVEELGKKVSIFIMRLLERDIKIENNILKFFSTFNSPDSITILDEIYKRTNKKEILKVMKKTAHTLKQKGYEISLPEEKNNNDAVFRKITLPEENAFLSQIDAEGYRFIIMIKPVTAYENKIFYFLINDSIGIREIEVINSLRKEKQKFIEKFLHEQKADFIETEPEHASFLIEEACKITEAQGNIIPTNIEQWKRFFSDMIGKRQYPVIYDQFKKEEILSETHLLDNVNSLFEQTDLLLWFLFSSNANEQWMKIKNIIHSPIVLSSIQKKERIQGLIQETARLFFHEKRRKVFKRRLEELSYFFFIKGDTDIARISLCSALSLNAPGMVPEHNLFCLNIIEKGFQYIESVNKQGVANKEGQIINKNNVSLLA